MIEVGERSILDLCAEYELESGTALQLTDIIVDFPASEEPAIRRSIEALVAAGLLEPDGPDGVKATRRGVLASASASRWNETGARILAYLRERLTREKSKFKSFTWQDLTASGVASGDAEFGAFVRVISTFRLSASSSHGHGPPPHAQWRVPQFLLRLRGVTTLRQLDELLGELLPQQPVPLPNLAVDVGTLHKALYDWDRARIAAGELAGTFQSKSASQLLAWSPERLNRAVAVLEQQGCLRVDRRAGTAPFLTQGFCLNEAGILQWERRSAPPPEVRKEIVMPPSRPPSASASARHADVVVLTALRVEYDAVRRHVQEVKEVVHPKGTVYEVGRIGTLDVAIAEIGPGNLPAAQEAERALEFFGAKTIAFVGVAGGLKDVAIGDVVVGTQIYGYEGGRDDGNFRARPSVAETSYRFVQRARAEARSWQFGGPDSPSRVFVGPIAAGEKLVASTASPTAQLLKTHYNDALAVEMEGRGTCVAAHARDVEALIVRGISDLVDEKEAADRSGSQGRASEHAASFAMALLQKVLTSASEERGERSGDGDPPPENDEAQDSHGGRHAWAYRSLLAFDDAITAAIPGRRGTHEFTGADAAARLALFLETYGGRQGFAKDYLWWFRGNTHNFIEGWRWLDQSANTLLLDDDELRVAKVVFHRDSSSWYNAIYVETLASEPRTAWVTNGHSALPRHEEFAELDGRVISLYEFEDGSAEVDGEIIPATGAERRRRWIDPYNFVIAPKASPLNNGATDAQLAHLLAEILQGRSTSGGLFEWFESLQRPILT